MQGFPAQGTADTPCFMTQLAGQATLVHMSGGGVHLSAFALEMLPSEHLPVAPALHSVNPALQRVHLTPLFGQPAEPVPAVPFGHVQVLPQMHFPATSV